MISAGMFMQFFSLYDLYAQWETSGVFDFLILAGLFMTSGNIGEWMPTFFWGGVVIGLIIVITVLNSFAWFGSFWWQANWVSVVWIAVLLAILAPFFVEPKTKKEKIAENKLYTLPIEKVRE